jgi:hypothetical protein
MGNATPPVKSLPVEPGLAITAKGTPITAKYGREVPQLLVSKLKKLSSQYITAFDRRHPSSTGPKAKCRKENVMADWDDSEAGNGKETPDSTASYIAALTEELAKMARRNGLDTLSFILEMAHIEADQAAKE